MLSKIIPAITSTRIFRLLFLSTSNKTSNKAKITQIKNNLFGGNKLWHADFFIQ